MLIWKKLYYPLLLILLFISQSCQTTTPPIGALIKDTPVERQYLTIIDYYQAGGELADRYLAEFDGINAGNIDSIIASAQRACVRITIKWDYRRENGTETYTVGQGTGVLIEGGRYILSVGHNFSRALNTEHRIAAILMNGTNLEVELLRSTYDQATLDGEDWAVLKNLSYKLGQPYVKFTDPVVGEKSVIMGYPNNIGIDREGNYIYRHDLPQYLAPVKSVWEITSLNPFRLYPVAGGAILEGFSGGPILNFEGEVIGVLSGSVRFGGSSEIYVDARDVLDIINRYYDLEAEIK